MKGVLNPSLQFVRGIEFILSVLAIKTMEVIVPTYWFHITLRGVEPIIFVILALILFWIFELKKYDLFNLFLKYVYLNSIIRFNNIF